MKQVTRILILLFVVLIVQIGSVEAQNWKKIAADKAKKEAQRKLDKKKDKNKTETTTITTESETVVEETVVEEPVVEDKLEKIDFDENAICVEYDRLFNKMKFDKKTGEFKISSITIRNLPDVNYGFGSKDHKITAILKNEGKELKRFPFNGGNNIQEWTSMEQMNLDRQTASYTVNTVGKYSLEFQIDGQKVDEFKFNIAQSINKAGNSGWFITGSIENLGFIEPQKFDSNVPNQGSYFIFRFFEAILNVDYKFVDATPISIRIMRENPNGKDIYIGGYLQEKLSHNSTWKLTDNIFFKTTDNKYVTYGDVSKIDGKYYIDLFYNNDVYRYNFEAKDNLLLSEHSIRGKAGACWVERELVSSAKYEGFKPTANLNGKADDLRVSIKPKGEGSTKGYSTSQSAVFSDGQLLFISIYPKAEIKKKYEYQLTECIISLKKGDEIIAQTINTDIFVNNGNYPSVTFNTDKSIALANSFAYEFMDAMAKLPAGNHKLKFVYEIATADQSDIVGIRTVTFKSDGKNPLYTKWAENTKLQASMSNSEKGELLFLRMPSEDWVYYENNCGRTVWLRQDGHQEYYLYPGDKAKFNRSGFWEQWNFGTLKWNEVEEFDVNKTIYKLDANEISKLRVKQVSEEIITKLKPIQDVEFKTQSAFITKVKALIGEEAFKKHEELLVQSASIDFVKICN